MILNYSFSDVVNPREGKLDYQIDGFHLKLVPLLTLCTFFAHIVHNDPNGFLGLDRRNTQIPNILEFLHPTIQWETHLLSLYYVSLDTGKKLLT